MKRLHLFVTTCTALTLSCKTGGSKSDAKSQSAVDQSAIEIDSELGELPRRGSILQLWRNGSRDGLRDHCP